MSFVFYQKVYKVIPSKVSVLIVESIVAIDNVWSIEVHFDYGSRTLIVKCIMKKNNTTYSLDNVVSLQELKVLLI